MTHGHDPRRTDAVFFDVDFTLIYPGPAFQGVGYRGFCARHGIAVEALHFDEAVRAALASLDDAGHVYEDEIFIRYTRRIIEGMGGRAADEILDACAAEIYVEWARCHHFHLYDDVAGVMRELAAQDIKVGLISNSHRSLEEFQQHFRLGAVIAAAVSSAEHGYLKPHPSIFHEALQRAGVRADASVMVGDSVAHDVEGARGVGMRPVLLHRAGGSAPAVDVPVIRTLAELPALL
jgi:FMN hydrolase / 5-amino-6-(5-phospho-D-ribitylamino)uracil phosphatase